MSVEYTKFKYNSLFLLLLLTPLLGNFQKKKLTIALHCIRVLGLKLQKLCIVHSPLINLYELNVLYW